MSKKTAVDCQRKQQLNVKEKGLRAKAIPAGLSSCSHGITCGDNRSEPKFSESCYIHPKPLKGQTAVTYITLEKCYSCCPEGISKESRQELGLHAYTGLSHFFTQRDFLMSSI